MFPELNKALCVKLFEAYRRENKTGELLPFAEWLNKKLMALVADGTREKITITTVYKKKIIVDFTSRECSRCGRILPMDMFHRNGQKGRRADCKDCFYERHVKPRATINTGHKKVKVV